VTLDQGSQTQIDRRAKIQKNDPRAAIENTSAGRELLKKDLILS
jgi:hypothetical protein